MWKSVYLKYKWHGPHKRKWKMGVNSKDPVIVAYVGLRDAVRNLAAQGLKAVEVAADITDEQLDLAADAIGKTQIYPSGIEDLIVRLAVEVVRVVDTVPEHIEVAARRIREYVEAEGI